MQRDGPASCFERSDLVQYTLADQKSLSGSYDPIFALFEIRARALTFTALAVLGEHCHSDRKSLPTENTVVPK